MVAVLMTILDHKNEHNEGWLEMKNDKYRSNYFKRADLHFKASKKTTLLILERLIYVSEKILSSLVIRLF